MSLVRLLGFRTLTCGCVIGRYRELATSREVTYVEIARHVAARVGVSPELVQPVAAATRGIGPGEAPRHPSLACDDFGLAPIEPFDVVDAVLELDGGLRPPT